jgi:hypothetical protein
MTELPVFGVSDPHEALASRCCRASSILARRISPSEVLAKAD